MRIERIEELRRVNIGSRKPQPLAVNDNTVSRPRAWRRAPLPAGIEEIRQQNKFTEWQAGTQATTTTSILSARGHQRRLPHRERVVTREHEVHGLSIHAHPFRRQAAALAGAHIPILRVERRRPRSPRLRRIVDAKSALKAHALRMGAVRKNLAPEITAKRSVVGQ